MTCAWNWISNFSYALHYLLFDKHQLDFCSWKLFGVHLHIVAKSGCIQLFKSALFSQFPGKYKRTSYLRKARCVHSCSICIISRIWNKKRRIHLICCVYHLMNLYKQPGNKKELLPVLCVLLHMYATHAPVSHEAIVEMHQPLLTLRLGLPPLLAVPKTLCGLKRIWIKLVLCKGKLILTILWSLYIVLHVCSTAQLSRTST